MDKQARPAQPVASAWPRRSTNVRSSENLSRWSKQLPQTRVQPSEAGQETTPEDLQPSIRAPTPPQSPNPTRYTGAAIRTAPGQTIRGARRIPEERSGTVENPTTNNTTQTSLL